VQPTTSIMEGRLRRHAVICAAVMATVVLVYTPLIIEIIGVTDYIEAMTWATALVVVGIACAIVASWFIRHHYAAQTEGRTLLLFSLGGFPWLLGCVLSFLGAAPWAFWLAAIASVLLYGWWAWTTRTATPLHNPDADGASLDSAGRELSD
jgi:hypothetical protein